MRPILPTTLRHWHLFYLSLIIAIGFALRLTSLDSLPLSLSLDEATNGLDALQLLRLRWLTPFLQNNFGRESLFFYLQGLALQLFGISFFSLRFVSVLAGTLTIPLLYSIGQRLQLNDLLVGNRSVMRVAAPCSRLIGLLAATGLAISYWHVYFSRLGLRAILLPPLLLALIYCFWRGWDRDQGRTLTGTGSGARLRTEAEEQRPRGMELFVSLRKNGRLWLVIAGFLLGLTLYTYLAARLLPVLFLIFGGVELFTAQASRKEKGIGLLLLGLVATITALPLILYFQQNPQAFGSRTQAISVLASEAPFETLLGNLTSLLQLHFLAGTWLEQWPALNVVTAFGLLIGLPVCLYYLRKPAVLFLLLWAGIGLAPVLLSIQDWSAQTTILRGIIAWPAIFLISAIGLTMVAGWLFRNFRDVGIWGTAMLWLLLIVGGLTTGYRYFSTWASTYNRFSDHPAYLARYLNSQTEQLTLTPVKFYAETVTHFLLQAHYPTLTNMDADQLQSLIDSHPASVYLLPHQSTAEAAFVLLKPAASGQGTAYLLPPLTPAQLEALARHTESLAPRSTVRDSEQEPIAQVYPLTTEAPFLPSAALQNEEAVEPIMASFNRELLLRSYRIEPAIIKPGQTVALSFQWQAQRPIDGDYNLFIHLFDVAQAQRYGQVNTPLTGLLFSAHRWPVGLAVPDTHYFSLPADAPDGIYRFEVGLYHTASQERLPVTTEPGQPADDKLILGKLRVQRQPPAPPQQPLTNTQFGDKIALIGVDLPTEPLHPGRPLEFRLHWQALAPIPQDYTVFTHLLDSEGNLVAQQDNAPLQGLYPTSGWDVDEIVIDPYTLTLPAELAPGPYQLRVGLYQPDTGQRLSLKNSAQDFVDLPSSITIQD